MLKAAVVSSNISDVGFDKGTLFIRFKSGDTYSYDHVPYDCYDALQKVESAGQYFHRFIRSKFNYHKLSTDPFNGGKHDKAAVREVSMA